jgi:IclR family transcriptional regulator, pca regulon regulatory protein
VILSTYGDAALQRWLDAHDFGSFTPHTTTDPVRFRDTVQAARGLGYWLTEQQLDVGLRGLGVAVKDRKGECCGAVSMTLQMQPLSAAQVIERLLPLLQELAQGLRPLL